MHDKHISGIRAFNRFYTGIIGLLDKYILDSKYTLPEVRILYELYHHNGMAASDIIEALDIDKGYLSRILSQFEKQKLISKKRSAEDGRSTHIYLTVKGRKEFEVLNSASDSQIKNILSQLPTGDCDKLLHYMAEIKQILIKADKI